MPDSLVAPRDFVIRVSGRGSAQLLDRVAARTGETRAQIADRVAASPLVKSRAVAAFIVPSLALLLTALHARRRRLVAEHVLLAIHLQTFLFLAVGELAVLAAMFGFADGLLHRLGAVPGSAAHRTFLHVLALSLVVATAVGHLHAALRRVYGLRRWEAAWRAAAIAVALPLVLAFTQKLLILAVAAAR